MAKALSKHNKSASPLLPESDERMGVEKNLSPAETSRYIAEFTAELSYMARQSRLDLLAYLLDMARLEASRSSKEG